MSTTTSPLPTAAPERSEASLEAERQARHRKRMIRVWRVVALVVWLGTWELASGTLIDPFFSSAPSLIGVRVWEWLSTGYIWVHLGATLREMGLGLLAGSVLGIVVGFVLGRAGMLAAIADPFITAVYSLPKLALAPLFILWFGIGLLSKVVLVGLIVFFLVFFNTYAGVRDVDRLYINALKIMGGNRRDVYLKVILPSSSIWVFTGLKVAVPYALIGAIVGELISSSQGLGYIINNASSFFDTTGVLAGLVYVAAIAITVNYLVGVAERRFMVWKDSEVGVGGGL
ncbi:ABC transporter permease [Euzebya rosea]|uniref:ABC transporter permease n=1 Tax=Euzebya rosea TaxID=2052804 RepID=UPI00196A33D0|nr:ABC transporter permease [Euzebya rosea]